MFYRLGTIPEVEEVGDDGVSRVRVRGTRRVERNNKRRITGHRTRRQRRDRGCVRRARSVADERVIAGTRAVNQRD